ncbi:MAG TPA: hypothetical protein VEA38_13535, partial [Terriglobales bacterium]|nr:hypothetical protein [Terriglobales bacterium]
MAGERIDITLPTGEAATVPREDLDQALAAGAHVQSDGERAKEELGPVFGPVAAGVLGAGRTMTFGTSDHALTETAGYLGGDKAREHMLYALNATKEAFPDATTAGEVGGLFIPSGAGSAIMKAGEIAEKGATTLLGKGLVGTVAGYGLRGGVEAGIMGVGKQISEDALADREHDGETLIAAGKKDFLVGAPIGAAFGLLAAGASRAAGNASGLLAGKGRGPLPNRVLDEVAGVEGAGARLASDAKAAQTTIEDLRKAGLTSEQAAKVVDGAQSFAEARAAAGPFSGLVDSVADIVLKNRTAANPELGAVAKRSYQEASKRVAGYESTLDGYALKLKKLTDRVFRGEDVLDEVQFTYKAEQMARHVEPGLLDAQRDTVAKLLQDTDDMLRFWESTEAKGGVGGSIKTLRANHTDLLYKLAKVDESGAATTSRDLFIGVDKFKRTLDQYARHGEKNGLPEAILHADNGIRPMADRWRATLEDAGVWGKAGDVQREWNASFAIGKTRRDDFRSRFAVRLDQDRGQWVPEADAEKFKNNLLRKIGSEADSQQTLKSTDTWRETVSTRDAKVREYGELTPRQIEALDDARAAR